MKFTEKEKLHDMRFTACKVIPTFYEDSAIFHVDNSFVQRIDHFTVSCLAACPLNESEAGGDLVLIETSLLFSC